MTKTNSAYTLISVSASVATTGGWTDIGHKYSQAPVFTYVVQMASVSTTTDAFLEALYESTGVSVVATLVSVAGAATGITQGTVQGPVPKIRGRITGGSGAGTVIIKVYG